MPHSHFSLPEHIPVHFDVTDEKCLAKHDWLQTHLQYVGCNDKSPIDYFHSLRSVVSCPWQVKRGRPLKDLSCYYYSCMVLPKTEEKKSHLAAFRWNRYMNCSWAPTILYITKRGSLSNTLCNVVSLLNCQRYQLVNTLFLEINNFEVTDLEQMTNLI